MSCLPWSSRPICERQPETERYEGHGHGHGRPVSGQSFASSSVGRGVPQDCHRAHGCHLLHRGLSSRARLQDLSVNEYVRFADKGNVPFAYLAGVRFKNRMLGDIQSRRGGDIVSDNSGQDHQLGVLETNELAFKYLSQAAEGNHALAMQSLAECYENGTGVRKSMRMCRDWLWRASLHHSAGALPILDSKYVVPLEIMGSCQMLEQVPAHIQPGACLNLCGPTIGGLLVALYQPLSAHNYMLPAFASETPTLYVGTRPRQGTTGFSRHFIHRQLEDGCFEHGPPRGSRNRGAAHIRKTRCWQSRYCTDLWRGLSTS
jgi:hypothetical protein